MGVFRDLKDFVHRPFARTRSLAGLAVSIAALVKLIVDGIGYPVTDWLMILLRGYQILSDFIWWPLEWPAEYVAKYLNAIIDHLGWKISMNPWWKSYWTPQVLYTIAVSQAAWRQYGARDLRRVYLGTGFLVFFASSIAASNWSLSDYSVKPMIIIGLAFAVFHLSGILWQHFSQSNPNAPRTALWLFLLAYPFANVVIVLTIAILSLFALNLSGSTLPVVAQVLLAVFAMGVRDLSVGVYGATCLRPAEMSWWEAFRGYGTTEHGFYVLCGLAGAAFFVAVGVRFAAHSLPY